MRYKTGISICSNFNDAEAQSRDNIVHEGDAEQRVGTNDKIQPTLNPFIRATMLPRSSPGQTHVFDIEAVFGSGRGRRGEARQVASQFANRSISFCERKDGAPFSL